MALTSIKPRAAAHIAALSALGCFCGGDCETPNVLLSGNTEARKMRLTPERTVAVGATHTLTLRAEWVMSWDDAPAALTHATSQHPAIATARADADKLHVTGSSPGEAALDLAATVGESSATDVLKVRVAAPDHVHLDPCVKRREVVYAAGELAIVPFRLYSRNPERQLAGRGLYPVTISPAGAASVDMTESDEQVLALKVAPDAPETITLTSTLPGEPRTYAMKIVPKRAIRKLGVTYPEGEHVTRGERKRVFVAYETEADEVVCSRLPYKVKEQGESSKLCTFEPDVALSQSGDIYGAAAGIMVEALVTGTCQLVLVAALEGAQIAATAAISLAITAPSGGGGGWD